MMNLRLPPSSAFSCMTAWAVVALPEKKSRMIGDSSLDIKEVSSSISTLFELPILNISFIRVRGFGLSNSLPLNNSFINEVPLPLLYSGL